jgi:lipoprotein signal peptidase
MLYRRFACFTRPNWRVNLFFALSIAPLLSHLVDRLRQGYVVDFLHFGGLPIFNFADLLPDIAIALLLAELVVLFRARRRPALPRLATQD